MAPHPDALFYPGRREVLATANGNRAPRTGESISEAECGLTTPPQSPGGLHLRARVVVVKCVCL